MDEATLTALRQRMGDEYLGKRLRSQVEHMVRNPGQGKGGLHYENSPLFVHVTRLALRLSGLMGRGQRNALQFRLTENPVPFRSLPPAFAGLRILHLSDLHLDGWPGLGGRIAQAITGSAFDLCVLTGDFRFFDAGRYAHIEEELCALAPALRCRLGSYAILGNHDFIEMAPIIEGAGIRLLLNEGLALEQNGSRLWLAGLDDAHFYGVHDFERALRGAPADGPRILLAHSPELLAEAARRGFGLYLAGHTHAGQICLPGGFAPLVNARCERKYAAGAWQYGRMCGYTSAGVGSSGVFARFNCPPEITIHTLQPASAV